MANIKKAKNVFGGDVMLITHERAVRDDSGTTLETKLQMINQQLDDGVFDVSVKLPTGGVGGGNTYTLGGALAVLNANLSANKKKGGMSIKFIDSVSGEYVQYRYMLQYENTPAGNSAFINVANWQGVDETIKSGSKNLAESGGVVDAIATTEVVGKKEVSLPFFYGYTSKSGYSISDDGYITQQSSDSLRTVYTNNPVNKGAILHFTGTILQSGKFTVAISNVPITNENLTSVHLTILSNGTYTSDLDLYLTVPFDGYIAYYRSTSRWTNVSPNAYNNHKLELQDNSMLDISELNNASYASLSDALAAVPDIWQKGGVSIKFANSTSGKYEQYRLMNTSWSIDTGDWQGICNYLDNTDTGLITKEAVRTYTDSMLDWLFVGKAVSLTASDIVSSKYLHKDNTTADAVGYFHIKTFDVKESCCYSVNGYRGNNNNSVFYLWLDENDNVISYNDILPKQKAMTRELVKAPVGAVKLRVQGHSPSQEAECYEITARKQVLAILAQNLEVSIIANTVTVSIGKLDVINVRGVISSYVNLSTTISGYNVAIKWNPIDGLFAKETSDISDNDTLLLLKITKREVIGGLLYPQYIKDKGEANFTNIVLGIPDSYKNIAEFEFLRGKAISSDGSIITKTGTTRGVGKFTIQENKKYFLKGNVNTNTEAWYAMYSGENVVDVSSFGINSFTHKAAYLLIPSGVDTVYVEGSPNYPPQVFTLKDLSDMIGENKTIMPLLTHDMLRPSNGEFSTNTTFADGTRKCTPRFIKISGQCNVSSSLAGTIDVYEYDKSFAFISNQTIAVEANIGVDVILNYNTSYIKLQQVTANTAIPVIKLTGALSDNWDVFNPRPVNVESGGTGSTVFAPGFRRISVLVNITNPTCCDNVKYVVSYDDGGTTAEAEGILSDVSELPSEGSSGIIYHIESGVNAGFYMYINNSWAIVTIQHMLANDTQQLLPDYGMIALPETYTNTGKPTRLIIYCHGAAVNYSDSVRNFNTQDLEPEYWLAEGYAVMDIEGNPFNNEDEFSSIDCYIAAYKWAIEHFNLKRDGVFVGGRSMGGSTTFRLIEHTCPIPVIAACPNVPSPMVSGDGTAQRKRFRFEHIGFDIPAGFVFTGSEYTDAEKQLNYDNWDKLIKDTPILTMCTDLPTDAEGIRALVDCMTRRSPDRVNIWSKFHAVSKCPIKLFGCNQDEKCPPEFTSALYYRMLINAGQNTELRLYNSYKDYRGTNTSAHHADTQDPALRTTVTTRFGVEMTNIPIVYVEMLQFWRRYEQGN